MIDICQEKLIEACKGPITDLTDTEDDDTVTKHCSLLISMYSTHEGLDANLRLRVFNGTNKLYPEKPVHGSHSGKDSFKYFWFLSRGAMDATET